MYALSFRNLCFTIFELYGILHICYPKWESNKTYWLVFFNWLYILTFFQYFIIKNFRWQNWKNFSEHTYIFITSILPLTFHYMYIATYLFIHRPIWFFILCRVNFRHQCTSLRWDAYMYMYVCTSIVTHMHINF